MTSGQDEDAHVTIVDVSFLLPDNLSGEILSGNGYSYYCRRCCIDG